MGILKNKRLLKILIVLESLLLIPLIAMQFTTEVNWNYSDFIVFGILLLLAALLAELILRLVKNQERRILLIAVLVIGFLLVWAELAVGIFGSPFAGD